MKPQPVADRYSTAFWEGANRSVLTIQHCLSCDKLVHPPVPICPHCHSLEMLFDYRDVSGKARLRTWTVTRRPFIPAFRDEAPYVTAVGELDEQPELFLLARLKDVDPAGLKPGLELDVVFDPLGNGFSVPQFRIAMAPA